jgi:hypothetical protein
VSTDRYAGISFAPPAAVAQAVARGLALNAAHKRGGTTVGTARARVLAARSEVSPDDIRRMVRHFGRHEAAATVDGGAPSAEWVAWLMCGGTAGRAWARRTLRAMERADERAQADQRAATCGGGPSQAWGWLGDRVDRAPSSPPTTERARAALWRGWVQRAQGPAEDRLRQRWAGYLSASRRRVVERLAEVVPSTAGMDGRMVQRVLSSSDMAYVLSTDDEYDAAIEHIGQHRIRAILRVGFSEAASVLDVAEWDPLMDPSVAELAAQVRRVSPLTIQRTRAIVQTGLLEGESVQTIAGRLSRDIAYSPQRAVRIARTEATRLNGMGTRLAYEDAADKGSRFEIQWLSARDGIVRPTHEDADGMTVAPSEPFTLSSGAVGAGPGEFSEASEVVNCRCTTIPILRE